jgi:tellurite resistance protein
METKMENDELLKNIMAISIAIARIETQLTSQEKMMANEFILIQKEQTQVMSKVDDMDKDVRQIQKEFKLNLEKKHEDLKVELNKKIDVLEDRVDENDKFKLKITIAITLIVSAVAFGNQIIRLLGLE